MTDAALCFHNGLLFDGTRLLQGHVACFAQGRLVYLGPAERAPGGHRIDLQGDILFPGFVDLQVNGGGGVLFNADPSVDSLRRMAQAHRGLGVVAFLPTLITDTPQTTRAAIDAVQGALLAAVPGIAGLHLEGPHLSLARKGAHDGGLIRPMQDSDLRLLLEAAQALPVLKVTVAPETVTEAQLRALAQAGVLVSLGHTDADFDTCRRYMAAGARCVTHLFNAMSQLGSRAPGLVGAALGCGEVSCGMIADAVHVHPETMRLAWAAKRGPGRIFLVSDAMAVAGSDATSFDLNGRVIRRQDGRLTLEDGTLAGADLDLATAVRVMVRQVGLDLPSALGAATATPAGLLGRGYAFDRLEDVVRLAADLSGLRALGVPQG